MLRSLKTFDHILLGLGHQSVYYCLAYGYSIKIVEGDALFGTGGIKKNRNFGTGVE